MRKNLSLTVLAMALALSGSAFAAAAPSETRPNMNAGVRSGSNVWTWPIDKEARSRVWTEARSANARFAQVQVRSSRRALRRSAVLGGL
jgi:hypothetical protein